MASKHKNSHDHFFRYNFSQPDKARVFLKHFLPAEMVNLLNLDALQLESGSYIDEKLREHLTDILYTVPLRSGESASIYCLFEHKSYPAPTIHLQILRYCYERWQADTQAGIDWRPIVAVVFYHGQRKWTVPTNFIDRFGNVDPLLQRYIPNFEYILIDTSQYSDDMLREIQSGSLQASLFLLKYIYDETLSNRLQDVIQPLATEEHEQILSHLWAMISYITTASEHVDEGELHTTLASVFRESEEIMSTIAEKWREEGHNEGLKEGKEEGTRNTLRKLVQARFGSVSAEVISLIESCKLEQLDYMIDLALEAKTGDEFATRVATLSKPSA